MRGEVGVIGLLTVELTTDSLFYIIFYNGMLGVSGGSRGE